MRTTTPDSTSVGAARRETLRLLFAAGALVCAAIALLVLTADPTPNMTRKLFGLWRVRTVIAPMACLLAAGGLLAAAWSRGALLGYLAAGVGTIATIAALELVSFIGLVSWPQLISRQPTLATIGWDRTPNIDVSGTTVQDMSTSWGLPAQPIEFRYRTDRHGFRNHPDRAAADVYLLGDSMVVAALVPFEQTVTAQLESRLGVPVMQVALLGRSPQEEHQLFRDARLDARGKLVLQFIFEGNDLLDSRRVRTGAPELSSTPSSTQSTTPRERSLSLALLLALQRWTQPVHGAAALRTCEIGTERYAFGWVRDSFAGHEDEMPHITTALERFAAEVQSQGGRFAVVFVPAKLRVLGPQCRFPVTSELLDYHAHLSPLPEYLRAWSNDRKVPMLDLTAPLQDVAREGRVPWFPLDTHWNSVGHAVAADSLARWSAVRTAP